MKIENNLWLVSIKGKCPLCGFDAVGEVVTNSVDYIKLKKLHGGTENLKCDKCTHRFLTSDYIVVKSHEFLGNEEKNK